MVVQNQIFVFLKSDMTLFVDLTLTNLMAEMAEEMNHTRSCLLIGV